MTSKLKVTIISLFRRLYILYQVFYMVLHSYWLWHRLNQF